jgi:hypothetical protein
MNALQFCEFANDSLKNHKSGSWASMYLLE